MKKILSTILFVLLSVSLTYAAGNTSSDKARKVLDKAAAKINEKKGATASFTIKGDKIAQQSGTISIKGNKFQASTANAIIWYNGKTQWTYVKKSEEVNVSTPSAAAQASMNPYTFLNIYKKGYNMSLQQTSSGQQVHLTAQSTKASIKEMYVLVDNASNIKQVRMRQNSGWVTISISGLKSKTLPDSYFTFNSKDYPKAEVIDLR